MQTPPSRRLQNKIAIVTGGASGIGKAVVLEFASQGAAVAIADINPDNANAVATEIETAGGTAAAYEVDVSNPASIKSAVDGVVEQFGTIDILVNCAGINKFGRFWEFTTEEWEAIRSVNLDGPWHFSQAVVRVMLEKKYGKIVNIVSTAGTRATPRAAPYSTSKHGLVGLTRMLAVDLGEFGINANCICPASVDSPLLRETVSDAYRQAMIDRLPLRRLGKGEDIAKAAAFLASDDAEWITGAVLPVDGGLSCCNYGRHVE